MVRFQKNKRGVCHIVIPKTIQRMMGFKKGEEVDVRVSDDKTKVIIERVEGDGEDAE